MPTIQFTLIKPSCAALEQILLSPIFITLLFTISVHVGQNFNCQHMNLPDISMGPEPLCPWALQASAVRRSQPIRSSSQIMTDGSWWVSSPSPPLCWDHWGMFFTISRAPQLGKSPLDIVETGLKTCPLFIPFPFLSHLLSNLCLRVCFGETVK